MYPETYQGKIIEYIDQGRFVCTLCLQDKGNRLHLLTSNNREVSLSPKRAIFVSSSSFNTQNSREELLSELRQRETRRDNLKEQVQVKELWELVRDEKESFNHEDLAQLGFGVRITDDHISALVRALFEDRLHFKMKEGRFLPNSEEQIEEMTTKREEDARREANLSEGSAWLKDVFRQKKVQPPPCKDDIVKLLVELALCGSEGPNFKYGKELLARAGVTDIQKARNILVSLGVWEEDENLDLLQLEIRASFEEKELRESVRLAERPIGVGDREDMRNLDTFTIDGSSTRDFDDALSIEIERDSVLVGVHISDVAEAISPDSILDKEAARRGATLYLPRRQIPMLPVALSHDSLCLKEGCDRPTISLIARLDKGGNLLDYRFVRSIIRVRRQLTYDQVNEMYKEEPGLQMMYQLSQSLQQKRLRKGALILSLPEVSININQDSIISLEMMDQETPSRTIVAELMILYNWLAAEFCKDNRIPILFRNQGEPSERLSIDGVGYFYFVFKQRRKLNPLKVATDPGSHACLGLDFYTQASSPIRRYLDLVIQRQMKNFLMDRPPLYNGGELEQIRMNIEPTLKDIERVKRNRQRYWIQKYLLQHLGEKFTALILDKMKSKYRILLTDFLLVVEMKKVNGQDFSSGQKILTKVKKADPWNDLLNLEYAGPQLYPQFHNELS